MVKKNIYYLLSLFMLVLTVSSCTSDDEITQKAPEDEYLTKAQSLLNGDMVFSTKAWMGKVDKTHLENGCPTKFNFAWNSDGTMTISLVDFTVGAMPFAVTFKCKTKFMNLNSFEKEERTESGWIKFEGSNGNVSTSGDDADDCQEGSGATVYGFLNVETEMIEFVINYNMMTVTTNTFLQKIDKNRINNFEAEFKQYEKDLLQWKKDNGQA